MSITSSINNQQGPRVYYLQGDTGHDPHDDVCCCSEPHPLPHRARGARLYRLDLKGARAWHALRIGADVERFASWCQSQEPEAVYYGVDHEAASIAAIKQARQDGWVILNEPLPANATFPDDYQDARANYQDMPLYERSHSEPENAPLPVLDEAPFPLWIVPPGWRMARLSSIIAATGYALSVQDAGVLLTLAGVLYAPSLDLWGWKEALLTWHVDKTNDDLLLWRRTRV